MNNPNPFVPKGSLLELQSRRRSRLKLAVGCVLAVGITGLTAMLIQGCKRTAPDTEVPPAIETNNFPVVDTNIPSFTQVTNPPVIPPPFVTNPPVVTPPIAPIAPPAAASSEYTIVKGDSLARIAKAHGVSVSALEAANPGVVPTKLRIGQKITLPDGGSAAGAAAPAATLDGGSEAIYTVKSGDTLTRIARAHHTSVKAIQRANGLATSNIRVGQKLRIPSKVEAAPAPVPAPAVPAAPAPMSETAPAPALPPLATPPSGNGQ